jgi:hypothetical protein
MAPSKPRGRTAPEADDDPVQQPKKARGRTRKKKEPKEPKDRFKPIRLQIGEDGGLLASDE